MTEVAIAGGPRSSTRVLVVDDERFFREAIREILAEAGLECIEVGDGEQALGLARDPRIGVAILDIRLPGIDGIQVLARLRELRPELRVIMLSASTDQDQVLEALRLGACDYLAKPLHDEELVLAVRRAIESFGVAHDWHNLRGRLDRLVRGMSELAQEVRGADDERRSELLRSGAARTAAEVLEAAKTSLMLLNEEGTELQVAAAFGREIDPDEMDAVPVGDGVAGLAVARAEPLVVGDVAEDDRFPGREDGSRYRSGSFAVTPIESAAGPVGVLCATDREGGGVFGEEDLPILRLLAMQLSELMAVGRADAQAEPALDLAPADDATIPGYSGYEVPEVDYDAELARLVCDAVVSEVEPERVIRAALEPLAAGLPALPVALFLADHAAGALRREGEWDGGTRSDRDSLPLDKGLTGTVFQTGHLVATEQPDLDARFELDVDTPEDGVAGPMLCIPLRLRGKVVGVARAFLGEGGRASARTAEVLSAALSAAVRNVLLYRSLVESIEEVAAARRQSQSRS
ncbi:MAG: response regulator [Myxococcota bacterium]